jgi:hypothetical protein
MVHREIHFSNVGFEVFTAVVLKSIIFWDMTQRTTWRHIAEDDILHFSNVH